MGKNLQDKVVFITGASSGIGAATARAFVAQGAFVIATARSVDKLEKLREELGDRLVIYELDVRDDENVSKVIDHVLRTCNHIDIFINNAGYGMFDYLENMEPERIEDMIDTNVMGVIRCTTAVLPHMKARGSGHIINIASIAGKVPTPKSAAYTATKHAVHGFTHALRMELRGSGVMATAVNPGPVKTDFFNIADPSGQYLDSVGQFAVTAEDVARTVVRVARKPRMEADVPKFLGIGAQMYRAFPRLLDRILYRLTNIK